MQRAVKIFNDPVHGFIEAPRGVFLDILDHPWVQRLRRIQQLSLSNLVYPGATHTRLNHALGAYHLTKEALRQLAYKGIEISEEEELATLIAILLHDIGHGPFSHALEGHLAPGVHHEALSLALMHGLKAQMDGPLEEAMAIFQGEHPKFFLHQLISSQLDMDRLDYLIRDSFFTGVAEGVVGTARLIKTLNVVDNQLVVEQKGIYSVEKFLVARRIMYWQVYLHKTTLAGEQMLVNAMRRARQLRHAGEKVPAPEALQLCLDMQHQPQDLSGDFLDTFTELDDHDVLSALKMWRKHSDPVLRLLSDGLMNRRLFKVQFLESYHEAPAWEGHLQASREYCIQQLGVAPEDVEYFVFGGQVGNRGYLGEGDDPIQIICKDGVVRDLLQASDFTVMQALQKPVTKNYLCYYPAPSEAQIVEA